MNKSLNNIIYEQLKKLEITDYNDQIIPGENLIVGVPPAELEAWQSLLSHPDMPFQSLVRPDAELSKGFAYVLVDGTRLDVGISARDALVRSALGLLPQHASDSV